SPFIMMLVVFNRMLCSCPIPPPSPPSPSQGCNPYPFWVLVQHIIMSRRFLRVAITRLFPVFPVGGMPHSLHGVGSKTWHGI
ncbi:hypothetical protein V8C86DRAFT_2773629, partial [Haematococcus lacustris]